MSPVGRQTPPATLLVRAPATHEPERRYILRLVLAEWLGFDFELVGSSGSTASIALRGDEAGRHVILPDVLFATADGDWLTERCLPRRPLAAIHMDRPGNNGSPTRPEGSRAESLPVLFGGPHADGGAWEDTPGEITLGVDVFGSAFYLLTGFEEIVRQSRDEHDRFPAGAALSVLEDFVERPIVDEYVDLLAAAIGCLWPGLARRPTEYRLRLTHDIDVPWAAWARSAGAVARSVGGDLLRRRDPSLARRRVASWFDGRSGRFDRDPYATYDFIMETSERHGVRSLFYFMAGDGDGASGAERPYRLTDAPFPAILRRIHERGHEVGLHASYGSHCSPGRLRSEFAALVAACETAGFTQPEWGVRQHYLRFASPTTWRHHESAGLAHDSSFGFAERVGFRAGTCREYPVFDAVERRALNLRERPLVAMDATLFGYMGLGDDEAADRVRRIVGECRREAGDAVILYHNDTLARSSARAHYGQLVADLSRPSPHPTARS